MTMTRLLNLITNRITVVKEPRFTKNMFGSIEDIAGKTLEVLETSHTGDKLCIMNENGNPYIVDVDHRDIEI